jgi:hypothetical protein
VSLYSREEDEPQLWEFSKFRDFSENRSVLFPSALNTVPDLFAHVARLLRRKTVIDLFIRVTFRTERFSEKSLNLENSLNLRFGFPRVKRHFSYEGNEQFLTASQGSVLFSRSTLLKRKDLCFSCLRLGLIRHRRSKKPHTFFSNKVFATIFSWRYFESARGEIEMQRETTPEGTHRGADGRAQE